MQAYWMLRDYFRRGGCVGDSTASLQGSDAAIIIEPIGGAEDTEIAIAGQYWDLSGFDQDGKPLWAVSRLWIDVKMALDRGAALREGGVSPDASRNLAPPLARWQITHDACIAIDGVIHDQWLPTRTPAMLHFIAAMLQKTTWILHTDLSALLEEAARQSGRFTIADRQGPSSVDPTESCAPN
jgi:hypothetical protein